MSLPLRRSFDHAATGADDAPATPTVSRGVATGLACTSPPLAPSRPESLSLSCMSGRRTMLQR